MVNTGSSLRVFLETSVSPETFSRFYGARGSSYEELLGVFDGIVWVGEVRLKREFDFYYTDILVSDVPGLMNSLNERGSASQSRGILAWKWSSYPRPPRYLARRTSTVMRPLGCRVRSYRGV